MRIRTLRFAFALIVATSAASSFAEIHPVGPQLSSLAGAPYTVYLDFTGFTYPGNWGGGTPNSVPAYDTDNDPNTFSSDEMREINEAWAAVSQKYVGFNVNVTTVDPAAAGLTDAGRKDYYDVTAKMMHTIIGGDNAWFSTGAGGVSYVGTTQWSYPESEYHTNWAFPVNLGGGFPKYVAEAAAHENGHGLSLWHQHDENSGGEYSTNGGASGYGSYSPTVGVGYYSQRSTWREGDPNKGNYNDVAVILSNDGIGSLRDDGIGHDFFSATPLSMMGLDINSAFAKGFINPGSSLNPTPLGENNYTADFYSFQTGSGVVTLTVNDGTSFLKDGQADPGATLESVMRIFDAKGMLVATGIEDPSTLSETFSGFLTGGTYYLQVGALGGYTSAYEPNAHYYTMGGYFLSGKFESVPEPATFAVVGLGCAVMLRRRKK